MEEKMARKMIPIYAGEEGPVKVYKPKDSTKHPDDEWTPSKWEIFQERLFEWYHFYSPWGRRVDRWGDKLERFKKRYGILLIAAAAFTIYTIILSASVESKTEKRVWEEARTEYAAQLAAYKAELKEQEQASYFLSGEASREAFLNQEIDAAARLAAKMSNDTQKGGIICNALARVMNKNYPGTMREVVDQPQQWMFYDAENKFSTHDREIAEKILRAYYEDGIIPSGLTDEYVYGSWSENDYVLRNTWDFGSATRTWRYQG